MFYCDLISATTRSATVQRCYVSCHYRICLSAAFPNGHSSMKSKARERKYVCLMLAGCILDGSQVWLSYRKKQKQSCILHCNGIYFKMLNPNGQLSFQTSQVWCYRAKLGSNCLYSKHPAPSDTLRVWILMGALGASMCGLCEKKNSERGFTYQWTYGPKGLTHWNPHVIVW